MAIVHGTNSTETINAADGVTDLADTVYGYGGNDTIFGLGGNDFIIGGAGADNIDGGGAIDAAFYTDSSEGVTVSLATGKGKNGTAEGDTLTNVENLFGSAHDDTLIGNNGNNAISGMQGDDVIKGGGGADTLSGGTGRDTLFGMDSDDILYGSQGNDTLNGGAGIDAMSGGEGDDTYVADTLMDTITESAGQGSDTVRTSTSYQLAEGVDVEILETTDEDGTTEMWLIGNSSGNHIIGNDGTNVLSGNGGADVLEGRGGDDGYWVDGPGVTIIEAAGEGADAVMSVLLSYTLPEGADIEYLGTYYTDAPVELTGNSSGNVIEGNDGDNILNGRDGNDELIGYLGQDSFLFDTALNGMSNIDLLSDFNVADDTIWLDQDTFSSNLGLGNISSGEFVIGTAALDANDRIIYNATTGALLYDSDGVGGASAVQFAAMNSGLALTHLDFLVV